MNRFHWMHKTNCGRAQTLLFIKCELPCCDGFKILGSASIHLSISFFFPLFLCLFPAFVPVFFYFSHHIKFLYSYCIYSSINIIQQLQLKYLFFDSSLLLFSIRFIMLYTMYNTLIIHSLNSYYLECVFNLFVKLHTL